MKENTIALAASARTARAAAAPRARPHSAPARRTRQGAGEADLDELFIQEILCTFGPRWEW